MDLFPLGYNNQDKNTIFMIVVSHKNDDDECASHYIFEINKVYKKSYHEINKVLTVLKLINRGEGLKENRNNYVSSYEKKRR